MMTPQPPQNEQKILGPLTVHQFLVCLGGLFTVFILYKVLTIPYFLIGLVVVLIGVIRLGFMKGK